MRERVSSCYFLEEQQREMIADIGNEAIREVDRTYGRGYPLDGPAEHALAYHNGHHSRKVGEGAIKICTYLGLPPVEQEVAGASGKAHDITQQKGRGRDERESAEWLTRQMESAGLFSAGLRQMAALAVIGTEPLFENGRIVGQRATELEYPSKNAEYVAKSVASADMGELHTPEGPYLSHQLFQEINGLAPDSELPIDDLISFQQGNISLAETYAYPLAEAEELLATHRAQVIAHQRDILAKLEAGTIESWEELLRHDLAFIEKHRA